jgi:hypothetical protein
MRSEMVAFIISMSSRALILLKAGHEMKPMEETMTILHFENDPKRINALEEMGIMKVTTSDHMLNIIQNINLHYQMLQPLQDQTATSTDKC